MNFIQGEAHSHSPQQESRSPSPVPPLNLPKSKNEIVWKVQPEIPLHAKSP